MCGEENTSQAASVEFVRRRRTNYARGRLQSPCQKGILFDSLRAGAPIWERRSCKKYVCAYASSCCVTQAICASTLGTDVPPKDTRRVTQFLRSMAAYTPSSKSALKV